MKNMLESIQTGYQSMLIPMQSGIFGNPIGFQDLQYYKFWLLIYYLLFLKTKFYQKKLMKE